MPHRMLWAWVGMMDVVDAHDRLVVAIGGIMAQARGPKVSTAVEADQSRMHPQ